MSDPYKLKLCPFCGAEARVVIDECCVECTGCTAMTYCQDVVEPAIEQWNRRFLVLPPKVNPELALAELNTKLASRIRRAQGGG